MATTAFKSLPEVYYFPPTMFPQVWEFTNFGKAWNSGPFLQYLINSVVIVIGIIILQALTCIPAAYAYARYKFYGKNLMFGLTLIVLMVPVQVIFLPVYLQMSNWGLVNTLSDCSASSIIGMIIFGL
jgi:sn-glycerol 3-phosphate transport system permease protein